MTVDDIAAAADLAEQDANLLSNAHKAERSLATRVGRTERERHKEIAAVLFLRLMKQLGGTFVWADGPKQGDKHATVFEALVAEMDAFKGLPLKEKGDFIEENEPKLKAGFYAARRWLAEWYADTVFCVPQDEESHLPRVITLDPGYVLACGKTASQMQNERDRKLATGQIRSSSRRIFAVTRSKDDTRLQIENAVQKALKEFDLEVIATRATPTLDDL